MKFIDTNVLVYVADDADAAKQSVSREIVREALITNGCLISAQVLNEFSSVLFKKLKKTAQEVDGFLEVIERISTVAVMPEWTRMAIGLMSRYDIQFFDSLLLVAAQETGCDEILTEDLNDGQMYGSVKAVNPFKNL